MNRNRKHIARRWFLEQCGVGLGAMALGQLLQFGASSLGKNVWHELQSWESMACLPSVLLCSPS